MLPHLLVMQNVIFYADHKDILKYTMILLPKCYLQVEFPGVL
jgi:hypothetical protein